MDFLLALEAKFSLFFYHTNNHSNLRDFQNIFNLIFSKIFTFPLKKES